MRVLCPASQFVEINEGRGFSGQKPISFYSARLLFAGESHRKSYSDVARPTLVPSVGMIAQVLYNYG